MKILIKTLALVALFILSSCSTWYAETQQYPAANFSYRHSDFDYKIAWKTAQVNNAVIINGILKNVRYPNIDQLDLTIFLQGKDGKIRARATTIPVPQQSQMGEVVHFSTVLHNVALNPGDTFQFVIHYKGSEGDEDGVDWHSTFAVDAMTGAALHKDDVKPEEW